MIHKLFSAMFFLFLLIASISTQAQTAQIVFTHDGVVTTAHWSEDETRVLTASEDGYVRLWDTADDTPIWETDTGSPVIGLDWHPDETIVLTWTADGRILLLNSASGDVTVDSTGDLITGARWRSDGQEILFLSRERVYTSTLPVESDFAAGNLTIEHDSHVLTANWNNDETRILTLETNGIAHIWDSETGSELASIRLDEETLGVAWSAEESLIIAWGGNDLVQMYATDTGRGVRAFRHRTFVEGAIWNSDETRILSWGADDAAYLWDAATGDQIIALQHEDWVTGAIWNNDETRILSWSFNTLWLWADDGSLLQTFDHDALVNGAIWNNNETRILSWSWDGTARIWDVNGSP